MATYDANLYDLGADLSVSAPDIPQTYVANLLSGLDANPVSMSYPDIPQTFPVFVVLDTSQLGGALYRMRAYDQTLTTLVHWWSSQVDSAGADYSGPGPIVDIVVSNTVGGA